MLCWCIWCSACGALVWCIVWYGAVQWCGASGAGACCVVCVVWSMCCSAVV